MSKYIAQARKLRKVIETAMTSVDDITVCDAAELLPTLKGNGELIPAGTRINVNGKVMKATVDLWDTEENHPDKAETLWKVLNYKNGERIIPEVISAEEAFAKGELGYWKDTLYKSLYDANVWNPEQFMAGWEIVNVVET